MQHMKLANGKIFEVESVNEAFVFNKPNGIEVTFSSSTTLSDVLATYDGAFDVNALARFEMYDADMNLQGVHNGYVLVENVLINSGVIKVRLSMEEQIHTDVRDLKITAEESVSTMIALTEMYETMQLMQKRINVLESQLSGGNA